MEFLPKEAWDYHYIETRSLINLIHNTILDKGFSAVLDKVIFELEPYDNEYQGARQRIEKCLEEIKTEQWIKEDRMENDLARAIVSCLIKSKQNSKNSIEREALIHDQELEKTTKHNVYSYSNMRQYDPTKNGLNFLKHGICFDDVCSALEFGRLITHSFIKGQLRDVVFSKITNNGFRKYIVSIMIMSPISKKFSKSEIRKKSNDLAILVHSEFEKINKEIKVELNDIKSVIGKFNDVKEWQSKNPPMIFISSWLIDDSNFEDTIKDRIRDKSLDIETVKWLKERSVEILTEDRELTNWRG